MAARWSTPSGAQWVIGAGPHQATVVEVGGGLREYTVGGEAVIDPYASDKLAARSAGQQLAPWPNRLRDGEYTVGEETYQLPITEPDRSNAHHGLVRWASWHRVEQTPESIELEYVLPPQPGYPHALGLTTRWSVGSGGLRADHTVVNLGPTTAPFGFGTHPYLRVGDLALDDLVLELPAAERLLADDRMLPVGREQVAGTPFDFREPRLVGDLELDTTFGTLTRGDDGMARVRLTSGTGDQGVELWQDAAFDWIQVYSGLGPSDQARHTLAVEPMSCPPDAFRSGEGLIMLAPGDRWVGSWGITPLG